ncbi:hypothetical protein OB2597_07065 [Pseudooceanicola batsensis HTCC2597]|uniref:Uncharacterized protein n=1 Tax=Pseudooceanicola batsensis (strain ATCC BAA-863 / DSM 15984 / KCTC 12145 / HTCC2597) TaxID=252305 RepID=A3TTP8_PSEBH|nr:hypothetical protein OB2597_07065 [Pseudooceanicola batsensis HTCC2597]
MQQLIEKIAQALGLVPPPRPVPVRAAAGRDGRGGRRA